MKLAATCLRLFPSHVANGLLQPKVPASRARRVSPGPAESRVKGVRRAGSKHFARQLLAVLSTRAPIVGCVLLRSPRGSPWNVELQNCREFEGE